MTWPLHYTLTFWLHDTGWLTVLLGLALLLAGLVSVRLGFGNPPPALPTIVPLAGIAGFKELERKDEILRAIKLHHKLPEGLLGATLKRADQLARQQELEETDAARHEKRLADGAGGSVSLWLGLPA